MCVNYTPTRKELLPSQFNAELKIDIDWKPEAWQDYLAPFIRHNQRGEREALVGAYSMIPKQKIAPGLKRFSTMNARAETVGQLRSYAKPWREGQLCLVPMQHFFEPNYQSGKAERWRIGLNDMNDFAVAGLYREWREWRDPHPDRSQMNDMQEASVVDENGNLLSFSFTQLTINADDHGVMRRFHKPGDEKRSLVILHQDDYDAWLACRNPEQARTYLQLFPAEQMWAEPDPTIPISSKKKIVELKNEVPTRVLPIQGSLLD
jgi:putative SOS response-associated peptidase YedK